MNKHKKLLIPFLLLLLIGIGFVYFRSQNKPEPMPTPQVIRELTADLTIDLVTNQKSFDISRYIGKTAIEATVGVLNGKVKMTGSGINAFVTSIEGVEANSKKHEFWELVINGESAEIGAGSYTIQNGDQIKWRISKY